MLTLRTASLPLTAAAAAALLPAAAHGHELRAYLSQGGLDFVAEQVPSMVPKDLYPNDMSEDWACMTATQRDTHVELTVHDFSITIPEEGRLRLYVNLSAAGEGVLHVDDIYACTGETTCQDQILVNDARATIDFDVRLEGGEAAVSVRSVDLDLSEDDIDINFSGCALDDIANWMIDFAKKYVTDMLLAKAEEMARDTLGPKVQEMLSGLGAFYGSIGSTDFNAALTDLNVLTSGIDIGAEVDLSSKYPAAECVLDWDPGEPVDVEGALPDLAAVSSHLGLAINFGVLNDALYHVWRRGLTCLTGDHLEALGIHLDTDYIMQILPGFPPGTTLGLEMTMTAPPRVAAASGDGAAVLMSIEGLSVVMIGHLPDGSEKRVEIGVDAEATAVVGIDVASNALVATPTSVDIKRMEMDQVYAAETGFDVARVRDLMETHMVPRMLEKMGTLPLTGPVFSAAGYAVILRSLGNTDAYLSVNADLFKIPEDDFGAPETSILEYPTGVVSPANAVLRVSGVDGMIPTELLQYVVTVNGVARPASFIKKFTVGAPGESGVYDVQVAAVDLSGNTDLTPASVQVTVDGIAPQVVLSGERVLQMSGGAAEIAWTMSDDMTPADALAARIELYRLTDPTDALSVEHVETIELPPGAQSGVVQVESGDVYRAEVHVVDAVGNVTVATVMIDADDGGCRIAGRSGSPLVIALGIALAAITLRPRRR